MHRTFKKVLIANRGEIAVRVTRTLREMGIAAVAVYSDADRAALHVRVADEAYPIGPAPAAESYLRVDKIVDVGQEGAAATPSTRATASSARTRRSPRRASAPGIVFIGPPASAMRAMGIKTAARDKMAAAGVPIVPGARCDDDRRGDAPRRRRSASR